MSSKTFSYFFFVLGLLFATVSVFMSTQPISHRTLHFSFGILSSGGISAVCFWVAGTLFRHRSV